MTLTHSEETRRGYAAFLVALPMAVGVLLASLATMNLIV